MAERLQKTLDVRPSVASLGTPVPADTSLAQTITAAGELGSEAILTKRKTDLESEIRDLGEEVFAATEGRDLEDATDRFKRLKKAKEQGILSDSMVNIEAEKILKQKISNNSVFAPELRKEAARILGFDPTGSEVQALFGKAGRTSASRPLSAAEKEMQTAQTIASTLGINQNDVFALIQKSKLSKLQADNQVSLAKVGQANAQTIFNASLDGIDAAVSDALGEALTVISQGGAVNPEMIQGQLLLAKNTEWAEYRGRLAEAGIAGADLSGLRAQFDKEWDAVEALNSSGTMENILKRQNATLMSAVSIQGIKLFPDLAVIDSGAGQAGVTEFLKLRSKISDPKQLELIARISPGFARISENQGAAYEAMSASYNRIMGLPVKSTASEDKGLDDFVTRNLIKDATDPQVRVRVLRSLQARGQTFKAFGDYGQKGVRASVTPEEVSYVQERWGVEFEPLVARTASALKANPTLKLTVSNGVLTVEAQPFTAFGTKGVFQGVPSGLSSDLKRINGMGTLVKNGWGNDVGESSFGFSERVANKIETLKADQEPTKTSTESDDAFAAFKKSPTNENREILRAINPDLVAAAERKVAERAGVSDAE